MPRAERNSRCDLAFEADAVGDGAILLEMAAAAAPFVGREWIVQYGLPVDVSVTGRNVRASAIASREGALVAVTPVDHEAPAGPGEVEVSLRHEKGWAVRDVGGAAVGGVVEDGVARWSVGVLPPGGGVFYVGK